MNVEIIQFDYSFTFEKTIVAKKINIKDYVWSIITQRFLRIILIRQLMKIYNLFQILTQKKLITYFQILLH